MLLLTRRPGDGLTIRLDPSIDPDTPIGELLGKTGIHLTVTQSRRRQVRIGITAPPEFAVLRDELMTTSAKHDSN
jgi:sRNA-binding carbon storage regulator CsrA